MFRTFKAGPEKSPEDRRRTGGQDRTPSKMFRTFEAGPEKSPENRFPGLVHPIYRKIFSHERGLRDSTAGRDTTAQG